MQQQEELEIETSELSEEQIEAIYVYLSLTYEDMTSEEQLYWNYILEKIDPEYEKED